MTDVADRRYLAGLRVVDAATGAPVERALEVSAPGARLLRNRSGTYVVATAPGLAAHTTRFEVPPGEPDPGSVPLRLTVGDPLGRYLPRTAVLALPRDPDPAHADGDESLFRPAVVAVYAAPAGALGVNWSGVRVTVLDRPVGGDSRPARGALLRVVEEGNGGRVLARGLSDERGEALVPVLGVPLTRFADGGGDDEGDSLASGPVVTSETRVRVEVVAEEGLPWPVDVDRLEDHAGEWLRNGDAPVRLALRTGRVEAVTIEIALTP